MIGVKTGKEPVTERRGFRKVTVGEVRRVLKSDHEPRGVMAQMAHRVIRFVPTDRAIDTTLRITPVVFAERVRGQGRSKIVLSSHVKEVPVRRGGEKVGTSRAIRAEVKKAKAEAKKAVLDNREAVLLTEGTLINTKKVAKEIVAQHRGWRS